MEQKLIKIFLPIISIILLLIDGHITTLLINLNSSSDFLIVSHVVLIAILGLFWIYHLNHIIWFLAFIGMIYDLYYLDLIGIVTIIFPLMGLLLSHLERYFEFNFLNTFLMLIIMIFCFENLIFFSTSLLEGKQILYSNFVFYQLMPTLLFNSIILIFIYPLLLRISKYKEEKEL